MLGTLADVPKYNSIFACPFAVPLFCCLLFPPMGWEGGCWGVQLGGGILGIAKHAGNLSLYGSLLGQVISIHSLSVGKYTSLFFG